MADWNGFGGLDLSGVAEASGYQRLQPGTYVVEATDAEIKDTATGGKMVVVDFSSTDGHGDIRMNFNVVNKNPQAVEIGLRQLKSFLVAGGHKNPDKPGDIKTLKGLKCQVVVGMGKPWRDNDGNERQSSEIKVFQALEGQTDTRAKADLDDEIPF
jgi:hypothetical protein